MFRNMMLSAQKFKDVLKRGAKKRLISNHSFCSVQQSVLNHVALTHKMSNYKVKNTAKTDWKLNICSVHHVSIRCSKFKHVLGI